MDAEEKYRFEERLAILGVVGRNPTPQEFKMAQDDAQDYREAIERQNDEHTNP